MYITIFVSKVREAAPNPRSEFKTFLKALWSSCFRGGWRKKKLFTRKVWALCTPWSLILIPLKHWFVFRLSILSPHLVISMLRFWAGTQQVRSLWKTADPICWLIDSWLMTHWPIWLIKHPISSKRDHDPANMKLLILCRHLACLLIQ